MQVASWHQKSPRSEGLRPGAFLVLLGALFLIEEAGERFFHHAPIWARYADVPVSATKVDLNHVLISGNDGFAVLAHAVFSRFFPVGMTPAYMLS